MYILLHSIWMNQYSWDVPDMIWIFGIFSSSVHYSRIHFGVAFILTCSLWHGLVMPKIRWKNQGPPGTGKTMTTAVLATCFAADNMSSGGTSRGSCEPLVVSRHFLAPPKSWKKIVGCQQWDVLVWRFFDGFTCQKQHVYWWFWGFPNFFQTFLIWMKMKKWSKGSSRSPLGLTFPEKSNILKGGPDTRLFVSSEGEGWRFDPPMAKVTVKATLETDPLPLLCFLNFGSVLFLRFCFYL